MHKRKFVSLILAIVAIVSFITGCDSKNEKEEKNEFMPTPLIIEETNDAQTGIYKGRITIMDENTSNTQYEGAIYIYIKDDTAIVMTNDYIRNKYSKGERE